MFLQNVRSETPSSLPRLSGYAVLLAIGIGAASVAAAGWIVLAAFLAIALALAVIASVGGSIAKGDCDKILVGWVLLYPLGYYVLSYPRDHPFIQFDRMVVCILLAGILIAPRSWTWGVPKDLRGSAIAWAAFVAAACLTLFKTENVLSVFREILDGLLVPAILGWYIVRQFRLGKNVKWLHSAICVISLYCAAIGLTEVIQQQDFFVFEASGDYLLQNQADPTEFTYLRANGPFLTTSTYAAAGLISFFLLAFLWTLINKDAGRLQRTFHFVGCLAALLQALIPVFRSVFITLVVAVIIDLFWVRGYQRMLRLAALGLLGSVLVGVSIALPAVFEDRASSENVVGRYSQDLQTWRIFIDHPVFGVGLLNFTSTATMNSRYQVDLQNQPPLNFPHNNLGWVAAETGLAGLIPFVLSQVLLLVAFRRLAGRGDRGQTAWRFFIFIYLSYWLMGMLETAGEFGELNVWFVFALALLYRFGYGVPKLAVSPQLSAAA